MAPIYWKTFSLGIYLVFIAAAAFAGGTTMAFIAIGHRRMQVLLSFTAGVMLGVGFLHLLPHAFYQLGNDINATAAWSIAGFFLMFLLERFFHGHAHHTADRDLLAHACELDHPRTKPRAADHSCELHHGAGQSSQWVWVGAFAGLSLHSLADGAALAASVNADVMHGAGMLAGLATFLAILLHKPFDAGIIATLMVHSDATPHMRTVVNGLYALVVPLGSIAFLLSLQFFGDAHGSLLGIALAMAAGAFLCIAAADLLPEVQFHSHDRVLLTVALASGLLVAFGITALEKSSHSHHSHSSSGHLMQPQ